MSDNESGDLPAWLMSLGVGCTLASPLLPLLGALPVPHTIALMVVLLGLTAAAGTRREPKEASPRGVLFVVVGAAATIAFGTGAAALRSDGPGRSGGSVTSSTTTSPAATSVIPTATPTEPPCDPPADALASPTFPASLIDEATEAIEKEGVGPDGRYLVGCIYETGLLRGDRGLYEVKLDGERMELLAWVAPITSQGPDKAGHASVVWRGASEALDQYPEGVPADRLVCNERRIAIVAEVRDDGRILALAVSDDFNAFVGLRGSGVGAWFVASLQVGRPVLPSGSSFRAGANVQVPTKGGPAAVVPASDAARVVTVDDLVGTGWCEFATNT